MNIEKSTNHISKNMAFKCIICDCDDALELSCHHPVCVDCIINLFSAFETTKCPVCREFIDMNEIIKLKPCARCKKLQTDYCQSCSNFLCQQCWPIIHSFKPLISHEKTTLEVNVDLRKKLLDQLASGLVNLKNIDDDIVKLKNESINKTPSVRDRTLDEIQKIFYTYRVQLDQQEQNIQQYIAEQSTLKLENCLAQKVQTKSYIEHCKGKLFEHKDDELEMIDTDVYTSNLEYNLIVNEITLPEIISKPSQEILVCDPYGIQRWYLKDKLHRSGDLPAVIFPDGHQEWYQNGRLHRLHNPAVINANGDQYWYHHGLLHRDDDLPAHIRADGTKIWYQDGKYHRDSGPAHVNNIGNSSWYKNGLLHRENDLPAQDYINGQKCWYIYGKLHRLNGPAMITSDEEEWYFNGKLHRSKGPAIIYEDGKQEWYSEGKLKYDLMVQLELLMIKKNGII